jgi:hypothetical protein
MSQSSVGSGTGNDSNENHATDALPSKTMGAETGTFGPSGVAVEKDEKESLTPERDLARDTQRPVDDLMKQALVSPNPENPGSFPDGPSPWEKDAAQGKA